MVSLGKRSGKIEIFTTEAQTAGQHLQCEHTPAVHHPGAHSRFFLSIIGILLCGFLATFFVVFCFFSYIQSSKINIQTMPTTHLGSLGHSHTFLLPSPLLKKKVSPNRCKKQSDPLQLQWNLKIFHKKIKSQKRSDSSVIHPKNRVTFL